MDHIDVLCVGHAAYDLVFKVDHHPGPDEKTVAGDFLGAGGGPASNAAVTVSRLGGTAAFAGYLGQDLYGDLHLQELVQEGVDTSLVVRGKTRSPLSAVLVKPDGRRALVNYRAGTDPLPAGAIDFTHATPRAILFDGLEPAISPQLADLARRIGIPTILDAGSVHPGTLALAGKVDYLVCAEKFARQYTDESDPSKALAALRSSNPWVVITQGDQGLIWAGEHGEGRLPAFPVPAVDTTGAGDVFHGAFALALVQGIPWEETLRFASAAAALSCTRLGARPGIPYLEEVQTFLRLRA